MPALILIDGSPLRAAEVSRLLGAPVVVEALQTGFSTSAPAPEQRARDKVLAHPTAAACVAEAVDLTTLDGRSLRLELDSENESRFCKWWRETPTRMVIAIAIRRGPRAEIEIVTGACEGAIAPQPAGPHVLGWDRLFVPAGETATLAQLIDAGETAEFRRDAYARVASALRAPA
jgi:hypothetical protein